MLAVAWKIEVVRQYKLQFSLISIPVHKTLNMQTNSTPIQSTRSLHATQTIDEITKLWKDFMSISPPNKTNQDKSKEAAFQIAHQILDLTQKILLLCKVDIL